MIHNLEQLNIHLFLEEYKIKTEKGTELDFYNHPYLWDIYQDLSPKQVCLKAAQIGFTTMAIIKSAWLCRFRGMDGIYTLPTAGDINEFSSGKVNRIIANNPILQQWTKDKDSVEQKRWGNNVIYYRGTFTDKAALMVSSDLNIHDEEDRSKLQVISQYASRLQHSKFKWEWHFSNPSVQGHGVSRYWKDSTQNHWFVKCSHCSQRQYLSYPDSFDEIKEIYICKHCHKEITQENIRKGEWVYKYKDKEFSGYWIPLMINPVYSAKDILKYKKSKPLDYFYNFVLGLPAISDTLSKVTPDIIFRNLTDEINDQENVVIGCDSGLQKHFVVGNDKGIFYYGKTDTWEDIEGLLKRFKRSVCVIDALPDLTEPRKLREKYKGRIFLCHYARDRKTMQLIRWGKDSEYGNVVVDRNRMIQVLIDEFADGRIPLQGTQEDWMDYYNHWDDIYRITENDALGVPVSRWETTTGEDHWCFDGNTKIITDNGLKNIKDIKVGENVLTRKGFKKVLRSGISDRNVKVIKVKFSNNAEIICTSKHKFFVKNKGYIALDTIAYCDIIETIIDNKTICQNVKQLFLKELNLGDIQKQGIEVKENIIRQAVTYLKKISEDYIKKFGKKKTGKLLKDIAFIIKTAIHKIIESRIWSVLKKENIFLYTQKNDGTIKSIRKNILNIWKRSDLCLTNGEKQKKEKNGIVNTLSNLLYWKNLRNLFALNVIKKEKLEVKVGENFVAENVVIVGTQESGELKEVYNLTVEDEHEYYANGILAQNCHASLYWRVAMDRFGHGKGDILGNNDTIKAERGIELAPDGTHNLILPDKNDDWR